VLEEVSNSDWKAEILTRKELFKEELPQRLTPSVKRAKPNHMSTLVKPIQPTGSNIENNLTIMTN
jgi:hypothetical protein